MMHESVLDQQQNVSANGANQTERGGAAGETIAISLNLSAQATTLLQQAFVAAQEATTEPTKPTMTHTNTAETVDPKGKKQQVHIEPIENISKPTASEKPESSHQAVNKHSSGKGSYCWRCYTKGHSITDCSAEMYCPICDCNEHMKTCCPKCRGDKPAALTCGYVVDGLGFFHIPHVTSQQQREESWTVIIRVTDGALSMPNIISELEHLMPTMWTWKVEAIGNNMFKTLFPNKAELQRMVEWGAVQSKFQNANLKIKEKMIYNKAVKVMPKVWVQFNGLTKELCYFLIIWAVGSILGITKDVDMVFTRKHEIC
jgi:hypothetical protein